LAEEHLRLGQSAVIDAVNPVEAPRAAWRNLATRYRADLAIIECVCVDEAHRRRIEARMRAIEGMTEITWAEAEKRRTAYEAWTDARLTLDASAHPAERLLSEAIVYLA
jgi:predicted kinase